METTVQTQESVPAEIKKWSWGAFFLGPIWGIFNNVWIALLGFIPLVNLVMIIVLGLKGNEWAWNNKEWRDVEHFQKVQRAWGWWGFGIFLVSLVISIIMMFLMLSAAVMITEV
ncbi:ribonuclease G [Desmospora profundinema]|uniref:Uncharacterized protein n=1 Tax=Desmospora profundinema TaxID=1571184 RepID=A0ABU1IPZ8_9BACL|nr:ribonuclease G [Desmospora profundinema]MDR6226877.1 hypothetical protein [Desmospora profundinema]